jgi:hypothetical protein
MASDEILSNIKRAHDLVGSPTGQTRPTKPTGLVETPFFGVFDQTDRKMGHRSVWSKLRILGQIDQTDRSPPPGRSGLANDF